MAVSRCLLFLCTCLLVLNFLSCPAQSKVVSGTIHTETPLSNWGFISRFCFLSRTGRLEFEFWYPTSYDEGTNGAQNIILYHDIQWPYVYGDRSSWMPKQNADNELVELMSCQDKEAVLIPENNQVINLTTRYRWSGCSIINRGDVPWYKCQGGRTFSSSRERWWYIVVANCATTKVTSDICSVCDDQLFTSDALIVDKHPFCVGLYLDYTITMTNDQNDNFFFKHFSADEFYILQITMVFIVIYGLLLFLSIYVAYSLHIRQLYHTTYKLYMASMCIEFVALVSQVIYWTDYGRTGSNNESWKNLGRFLEFSGTALFLILLILMGKGFTITRGRISTGGVIKLIVFSIFFIAMTITMFIWEVTTFDPGLVLYIYDSIPGYILIAIKIASWLWFCYAIFFTLKHYREKMTFYIPFFVLFTLWFWGGTVVALVAIDNIPRWQKEKIVQGCTLLCTFIGHLIFLILTWPTMANKTFPYHIKTTQVGAMETPPQPSTTNNNGTEAGTGGAYGPSDLSGTYQPLGERQFIDMFTTSHARSNGHARVDPDHFPHEKPEYAANR